MDVNNEYGTLAIQQGCVELLRVFHSFCVDNDIQYSIAYGTLLGAVRHKGFIPWDDDIDVLVDRENFDKIHNKISQSPLLLERLTEKTLWTERLTLRDADYSGSYAPTIDIFVLDHSPNNSILRKLKLFMIYALQGMIKYHLTMKKGSLLMKMFAFVTYMLGRPFTHKKKYRWYQGISKWGNRKETNYSQCYNTLFSYIPTRFPSNILDKIIRLPFEDIEVFALADYDIFLTAQYGDYMTPPKERKPVHLKNQEA